MYPSEERDLNPMEKKWQEWLAQIGSWCMRERLRHFEIAALSEAERWVRAG